MGVEFPNDARFAAWPYFVLQRFRVQSPRGGLREARESEYIRPKILALYSHPT
jgi:hypothetical protein